MSLQIKIEEITDLDLDRYCELQQKSFAAVFAKNQIDNRYLDSAFFSWKYNTPAGKARIAYVEENGCMLASVAMYPVYIGVKGVKLKSWHFVEAAVLPEARGNGLFQRCMNALIDSLTAGEAIYVFPNASSIKGTLKTGFQLVEQCRFYARFFFNILKRENVVVHASHLFPQEQDKYAEALSSAHDVIIFRDAAYMNWRYKQHPHFSYYTFTPVHNGRVVGNVVARVVFIKGAKLLLVMEMHSITGAAQNEITSFLKDVAAKEKCFVIGMFSGRSCKPSLLATGMVPLPSFLIPKEHTLMAYEKKPSNQLENTEWFTQTGDWDAF